MLRRLVAVVAVIAIAGILAAPADAKKPAAQTYYINWYGDCAGGGMLNLKPIPNADSCALYFPTLGDSYSFYGNEGMPLTLDATQPVVVDFTLTHVVSASADFEVVVEGSIKGKDKVIASGTQTVLAGVFVQATPMHFEMEADPALNKGKVTDLTVTISWTNGATYSQIDFNAGATLVLGGTR